MDQKMRMFIEDNVSLIESGLFDDVFKLLRTIPERIEFASIMLTCGIDYHVNNIKKSQRYNVNRFLLDLRIPRGYIGTIKKGPYTTGQYSINSSQYMVVLPVLLLDRIPDNIKQEYNIDRTETALVGAWVPYPQYSNDKTIIIINS